MLPTTDLRHSAVHGFSRNVNRLHDLDSTIARPVRKHCISSWAPPKWSTLPAILS